MQIFVWEQLATEQLAMEQLATEQLDTHQNNPGQFSQTGIYSLLLLIDFILIWLFSIALVAS